MSGRSGYRQHATEAATGCARKLKLSTDLSQRETGTCEMSNIASTVLAHCGSLTNIEAAGVQRLVGACQVIPESGCSQHARPRTSMLASQSPGHITNMYTIHTVRYR
jgi:hypothetical protein